MSVTLITNPCMHYKFTCNNSDTENDIAAVGHKLWVMWHFVYCEFSTLMLSITLNAISHNHYMQKLKHWYTVIKILPPRPQVVSHVTFCLLWIQHTKLSDQNELYKMLVPIIPAVISPYDMNHNQLVPFFKHVTANCLKEKFIPSWTRTHQMRVVITIRRNQS